MQVKGLDSLGPGNYELSPVIVLLSYVMIVLSEFPHSLSLSDPKVSEVGFLVLEILRCVHSFG